MPKNQIAGAFLLLILLSSCLKKVDFDNINDINYQAEWAIPLLQARLELNDIVADDSTFTVDPNGGIRIIFEDDSVAGIATAELVKVPDQEPNLFTITSGVPNAVFDLSMGTLAGAQFKNITIANGLLFWSVDNPVNNPVQIELAILNATLNNDSAKFIFQANQMGLDTGSIDISGLDFDLTVGDSTYNNLHYRLKILSDGGAPNGTNYNTNLQLKDLVIEDAVGYFGKRTIPLPSSVFNTQISGFENILNGLKIENPTIGLKIVGNVGIPFELSPDLDGINKNGAITPLTLPNIGYNGPLVQGDWDTSNIIINKGNSNIVDFISNVPSNIAFAGGVTVNPLGKSGFDNFVNKDGKMYVGVKIDIPLEIRTTNLLLEQWLYDIDWGVEADQLDIIELLKLHFKVTNGFPFDANLKMVFYDKVSGLASDSIDVDLLTSALINAQGQVIDPTITRSVIEFDQQNIKNLLTSNKIKLLVTLNSYNNGQDVVKLYASDFIKIAIGVQTKVNYNLGK